MKKKVLFICKNNSGRSQMAEGLLKHYYGEYYEVYSAGSIPSSINPLTIEVMSEIGIDISDHESKNLKKFQGMGFHYIITLCSPEEISCPVFPDGKILIHYQFTDPRVMGTTQEKLILLRTVRDEIKEWIIKEFKKRE